MLIVFSWLYTILYSILPPLKIILPHTSFPCFIETLALWDGFDDQLNKWMTIRIVAIKGKRCTLLYNHSVYNGQRERERWRKKLKECKRWAHIWIRAYKCYYNQVINRSMKTGHLPFCLIYCAVRCENTFWGLYGNRWFECEGLHSIVIINLMMINHKICWPNPSDSTSYRKSEKRE